MLQFRHPYKLFHSIKQNFETKITYRLYKFDCYFQEENQSYLRFVNKIKFASARKAASQKSSNWHSIQAWYYPAISFLRWKYEFAKAHDIFFPFCLFKTTMFFLIATWQLYFTDKNEGYACTVYLKRLDFVYYIDDCGLFDISPYLLCYIVTWEITISNF